MANLQLVDSESWDEIVGQAVKPVVVEFSMQNCQPCQVFGPILNEVSKEREDILVVECKLEMAMELAQRYEIRSVPTVKVFVDGEAVSSKTGLMQKDELNEFVSGSLDG